MSFNSTIRQKLFTGAAGASLLIGLLVAAGCGTDEDTVVKKSTPPPAVAQTPAPAPEPAPSVPETSAPAVQPVQEVTYTVAENAFFERRYDDAVDLFTRYTQREPNNTFGYYMLGLSAWKDGRLDVAEQAFQHSLELDPTHLKSCLNLSRVLLDAHRPSDALTVLDRALAIDTTCGDAYRLKGLAYHDLSQVDDALAAYQSALRLDPEDAWSMNNLAFIRIQQGRYDEALPALARAVELRKDVPVFYNNLGMALEHAGQFSAAADAYGFAASLDASNTRATTNHDRVAAVKDDPALPPVDLTALARAFEQTVDGWKVAATTTTAPADSLVSVQPR